MNQSTQVKRTGKWMFALAWVFALGLLTYLFSDVLEQQFNPNQMVETKQVGDTKEVVLKSSRHGHYVATGRINGVLVIFLVDTGASFVSIPEKIANKIGLRKGAMMQSSTANGTITTFATELDEISLGDIALQNVRASINPHMHENEVLLGMSFLRQLEVTHKDDQLTIRQ